MHKALNGAAPAAGPIPATSSRLPPKAGVAFKQAVLRALEARPAPAPPAAPQGRPTGITTPAAGRPAVASSPPSPNAFRQLIARLESGGTGRADQGYGARNPQSGALGRYQMLPVALRDIGWMDVAGQWTAQAESRGVRSEADFLRSPAAQEAAMNAYLRRSETLLARNGSLTRSGSSVTGLDGSAVPLTDAGLVAAAHRSGAASVARYLAHRGGTPEAPPSSADRGTFQAVERRLRQFAELPYQVAARRGSPAV